MTWRRWLAAALGVGALVLLGIQLARRRSGCDSTLTLPSGFCATLVADDIGPARHLVVAPNGDIYVALWREGARRGGILALRDTTGDGVADVREQFGQEAGPGIALRDSSLYFATWNRVFRYTLRRSLVPVDPPDTIVVDLPELEHGARSIAVDDIGHLFFNIGAPSNACERDYPHRDFVGDDPCRELATSGGIWRFDTSRRLQRPSVENRFATGLRHTVALGLDSDGVLYGTPHGIDHLHTWWPNAGFSAEDAARKPSETLFRIDSGGEYGFPYCMHDPDSKRMILAPGYGGDGRAVRRCASSTQPLVTFPAHSAPMALLFYHGRQFPARYRNGLFVAFHGSLFHEPLEPRGHSVSFVPFSGAAPSGETETFAKAGFALVGVAARPSGLAEGPDGSLYVTDDSRGKLWRVRWRGERR
jgi:glucose/arabinose dehydrogenase